MLALLLSGSPGRGQEQLKVREILFEGNVNISASELNAIIKSRKGMDFSQRMHRVDRTLITNYYQLRGFLKSYVTLDVRKEGNRITLVFQIREGYRSYLRDITIVGNEVLTDAQVRARFAIKDGDIYNRRAIEDGLNALENYYFNNGYPYLTLVDNESTESDSLISIKLYMQEDEPVKIEEVRFEGLERAQVYVPLREVEIKPGDLYSRRKIEQSQKNIYSSGLFERVNFRLTPLQGDRTRVILLWQLTEKKARWTGLRFGVSHEAAQSDVVTFDFTAEGGHRNLFGTARSLSLKAVPSIYYGRTSTTSSRKLLNPRNEYTVSYIEPWMFGTRTPGQLSLSYSQEAPPVATRELTTFSTLFRVSHEYDSRWTLTSGIGFERVQTNSDTLRIQIASGQDLIYSFYIDPLRDGRDNVFNPRRGFLTELRNKFIFSTSPDTVDGRAVSVRNTFYKGLFQWARYQKFPLRPSWVLATRVRAGGILELGQSKPVTQLPLTERFYIGGASSVRGYSENSIGGFVIDASGNRVPIGGKAIFLANAELRIPLFWLFYGETFIDAGNIWESWSALDSFTLKFGSGAGLVFVTPFGPIRFDYGFKLVPEKNESGGEFHIGIAFAF